MNKFFLRRQAALTRLGVTMAMPVLLGLASCASLTPGGKPAALAITPSDSSARPYHERIVMEGRLSLRYQQNYTENAVYGSFVWTQTPEHTLVTLRSPLGQTVATISLTPTEATLTQSGQPPQSASDVDSLAANTLGWPLPISGLRHWLQGYTLQDGKRVATDPFSRDTLVTGDGWSLTYADWNSDAGPLRPKRLDLLRHTAQAGDIALRLVIDEWLPEQAAQATAISTARP